ncbi:uncharacterized protein HKW66_Vig0246430 [Vigna angularis]|uniref:Uncharacterized protein n=1 Tax=Phaseolus angularis TaxID=3914 RepID=A0A8T0KBN4_PHAAN|nr:uncharacterized protein HKW66_Vig0246430 [Vigna angularis]
MNLGSLYLLKVVADEGFLRNNDIEARRDGGCAKKVALMVTVQRRRYWRSHDGFMVVAVSRLREIRVSAGEDDASVAE